MGKTLREGKRWEKEEKEHRLFSSSEGMAASVSCKNKSPTRGISPQFRQEKTMQVV